MEEFFIDTASSNFLKKHGKNFMLAPQEATKAVIIGEFAPESADVYGKTFSLGSMNYIVHQKLDSKEGSASYTLKCTTAGSEGNLSERNLIPVEDIPGLTSARVAGILTLGEEEESTEEFRVRLKQLVKSPPFGGNVSDYVEKVSEIDGVGAVKVIPCFDGEKIIGGHVYIKILDSDYNAASSELCEIVKKELTGGGTIGNGFGMAPIGHTVHIVSPTMVKVNVRAALYFKGSDKTGKNFDEVTRSSITQTVRDAIEEYFDSVKNVWFSGTDSELAYINTHRVISAFLSCENANDVWRVYISMNGEETSLYNRFDPDGCIPEIYLKKDSLPELGALTIEFGEYPS